MADDEVKLTVFEAELLCFVGITFAVYDLHTDKSLTETCLQAGLLRGTQYPLSYCLTGSTHIVPLPTEFEPHSIHM